MGIQKGVDIQYQNFKDGIKYLSQMRRVSPFGLKVSVAATILGAAASILAIKDGKVGNLIGSGNLWTSDRAHLVSRKSRFVPGLRNLGNNCFLNVILQALASCSSFQRYIEEIFEEYDFSGLESSEKKMPLSCALASLIENLSVTQDQRSSLNPRNVMSAMEHYIPSFSLTRQQDAEESFFYLVSSLRVELSECYTPNYSSLADVPTLHTSRILTPERRLKESEQQRWIRTFLGPFDGVLSSILSCQSCGFQSLLDFQPFHSLHLPPVLMNSGRIVAGCTVEGCLKQFFETERIENYFCSHCWHVAAIKYLGLTSENVPVLIYHAKIIPYSLPASLLLAETDIQMLQQCIADDTCQCKNLMSVKNIPWSNSFSRCVKRHSISRSPQILCIHLQRASVNNFGEVVKLMGHISFPFILDLSPFIMRRLGMENLVKRPEPMRPHLQSRIPAPRGDNLSLHLDTCLPNCNGKMSKVTSSELKMSEDNIHVLKAHSEDKSHSDSVITTDGSRSWKQAAGPSPSSHQKGHKYRLVSVVEHFGQARSGHYTVYRRVTAETSDEDPVALLEPAHAQWFRISDSEVERVSEKDVLDAEASLLFYEKLH